MGHLLKLINRRVPITHCKGIYSCELLYGVCIINNAINADKVLNLTLANPPAPAADGLLLQTAVG